MEVVRHQAVGHDPYWHADAGLAHDPDEGLQIVVLTKHPVLALPRLIT